MMTVINSQIQFILNSSACQAIFTPADSAVPTIQALAKTD
jgi:hypothetical protein